MLDLINLFTKLCKLISLKVDKFREVMMIVYVQCNMYTIIYFMTALLAIKKYNSSSKVLHLLNLVVVINYKLIKVNIQDWLFCIPLLAYIVITLIWLIKSIQINILLSKYRKSQTVQLLQKLNNSVVVKRLPNGCSNSVKLKYLKLSIPLNIFVLNVYLALLATYLILTK